MEDRFKYTGIGQGGLELFGNFATDLIQKYGVGGLNRQINLLDNQRDPKPDKQSREGYITYRNLISNDLRESLVKEDARILGESLSIYTWGDSLNDPTNTENVLFAPLSFYSFNRNKISNIQPLPGTKSSLKEYYTTEDYNINAQCLFYSHFQDVVPEEFLERFEEMMNYDGIIEVDNPFLNRFKIRYMYITDFSVNQSNILNNQNVAFSALSEKFLD